MRDPARIDRMCELLRQLWHAMPDQRLGQLINNLTSPHDVYALEDGPMERRLVVAVELGIVAAWDTK